MTGTLFLRACAICSGHLLNSVWVRGLNVSTKTVRKKPQEGGFDANSPATRVRLEIHNRKARLQFARGHVNWTREEWNQVLRSDESLFSLRSPEGLERDVLNVLPLRSTVRSIMVWGGVSRAATYELVLWTRHYQNM